MSTKDSKNEAGRSYAGTQENQQVRESYQVNQSIDQTKASVRRSIEEARREIPAYAQSVSDYHQQAMDSAQEIADNYLDSQRDIVNSVQHTWTEYIETVYWWLSPRKLADMYTQAVSNLADNAVSSARIMNKSILANMDASKAYLGRARESARDVARINTNTARTFERITDMSSSGSQSEQQTEARRRTQ